MSGGFDQIPFGPISTRHTADTVHAAEQVVLHRARDEEWTRQQILDVMEALGLIRYDSGGRAGALGQRAALTATEQRRRAAHEETS